MSSTQHIMRFDLDHDWQGNISTPRARIGERAKTRLLILLCAIWLLMGLIGHHPWKPFESDAISTIKNVIDTGNLLAPVSASNVQLSSPPLYYLSAAITSQALNDILPGHDAARVVTGLWMLITLLMIGMTGRELWGKGFGRQTSFIFISSIGLVIAAHTLMPEVSALTGIATGFYALALAKRRPYRASAFLSAGMTIAFLSSGVLPFSILILTSLILPCLFSDWRNLSYGKVIGIAILIAISISVGWMWLFYQETPALFNAWWSKSTTLADESLHLYFVNLLLWYAWPSLPLAVWAIWRYRAEVFYERKFQLSITFFCITLLIIGLYGESKDIYAIPLLVPLTAVAAGSIETLKRGAAGALNWFGLIVFGFLGFLIWLGWGAMMSGNPAKLKERLIFLSGLTKLDFNIISFSLASAMTLIFLFAAFRSKHSNRSAATNWAIGMTFVWTLLMTLWLPMIDSARSYSDVFMSFKKALPTQYTCVNSKNLGSAQRDLLHYYANIKTYPIQSGQNINCDLFLIQDERKPKKINLGNDWQQIWEGKRISERKESFRLFQQTQ
ncbi:MAG TPA: glycosyl transferase [Methylophilaceae bacterium]|nr:glycosyl transferase [Methylophilaceae bacterium]